MDAKETINKLKKTPYKKEKTKFHWIDARIWFLGQCAKIVINHEDELDLDLKENYRPDELILESIILEIVSFYDLIRTKKLKITLPNYYGTTKNGEFKGGLLEQFRHKIVAHTEDISPEKLGKLFEGVLAVGVNNIFDDYHKIKKEVFNQINI